MIYDPDNPVPQWAPGAAECLERLLEEEKGVVTVLEWGGGMSSPWILERLGENGFLFTVESNLDWVSRIWKMTKNHTNHCLAFAEDLSERYVEMASMVAALPGTRVWIIDGCQRVKCLFFALNILVSPGDILVMDDALDYVDDWRPPGVEVFAMPHPLAGKPVTHNRWGSTTLKVGDLHHETKETWCWIVR